jgi:cell division septum initiation protein DivIVA
LIINLAYCLIVIVRLHSVAVRRPRDNDDLVPLHEPFETALRGFNRQQVLEHLESLDGRIALAVADRDAALAQVAELSKALDQLRSESELLVHMRREAEKATTEVERILTMPMVEASVRIQRILKLAEEEAAELKTRAESEIVARRARADQDIAELRTRADDQITGLRAAASREAKALLEHARRQCDQLDSESAVRREVAEQDAASAIAQRESETHDRIRDSERRSVARMHLILRVMNEHLTNRVCVVERNETALHELRAQVADEVAALKKLRTEITAAVVATHKLMVEALGQVRRIDVQQEHQQPTEQDSFKQPEIPTPRGMPSDSMPNDSMPSGKVYLVNTTNTDDRRPRTPH